MRIAQVGQRRRLDPGFLFWLGGWAKELQVLGAQPAADISMSKDRGSCFCEDAVARGVVQMVMRVDHVADWQIRQLADFRQKVARNTRVLKSVHDENTVASDDKTSIATGLPTFIGDSCVDALSHFLVREIRASGGDRERANRQQKEHDFAVEHAADGNTLSMR